MAKTKATKPMSIELFIDGKKKKITQNGITLGAMRKIMKYYKRAEEIKENDTVDQLEMIDEMIVLITEIFQDPRVDFETIENSIMLDELAPLFGEIVGTALGTPQGEPTEAEKK